MIIYQKQNKSRHKKNLFFKFKFINRFGEEFQGCQSVKVKNPRKDENLRIS